MTSASALEYRSRYELVEEARSLGVERPERMTMQELKDEILRLTLSQEEQVGARGLFGVARAMLASVVEAGLKMPDAAKVIRGDVSLELPVRSRSPVATVTLAEIYAAQGHRGRALTVLAEVLAQEPDHEEALRIRAELLAGDASSAEPVPAPKATEAAVVRPSQDPPPEVPNPSVLPGGEAAFPVGEFPSTEYVPVVVVETTGHEVGLTPAPPSVVPSLPEEPPESEPACPLLVTVQRGTTLCLYWELPPEVVLRSGLTESEGQPAVVVVAFTPAGPTPLRDQRTMQLVWEAPYSGTLVVPDLGGQAAVRAAVGWMVEETFLPLAVGRSLEQLERESPAVAERAGTMLGKLAL